MKSCLSYTLFPYFRFFLSLNSPSRFFAFTFAVSENITVSWSLQPAQNKHVASLKYIVLLSSPILRPFRFSFVLRLTQHAFSNFVVFFPSVISTCFIIPAKQSISPLCMHSFFSHSLTLISLQSHIHAKGSNVYTSILAYMIDPFYTFRRLCADFTFLDSISLGWNRYERSLAKHLHCLMYSIYMVQYSLIQESMTRNSDKKGPGSTDGLGMYKIQ